MLTIPAEFRYPRRQRLRLVLKPVAHSLLRLLCHFQIEGKDNLPEKGPLLVVANHFTFADPVAVIASLPYPLEFFAGTVRPNAPAITRWLPEIWKIYPVVRGTGSRFALKAAEHVMAQDGVLGIFPEGGSWAKVLRPPRPGTAYVAARTGAPILPIGIVGLHNLFPRLRQGRRARVIVRIGQPFGPFAISGRGRERREQLDAIGHEIMQQIAALLPPAERGVYSEDPGLRAAAKAVAAFPWDPDSKE